MFLPLARHSRVRHRHCGKVARAPLSRGWKDLVNYLTRLGGHDGTDANPGHYDDTG